MAEPIVIDDEVNEHQPLKTVKKRKRVQSICLTSEEKAFKLHELKEEKDKLFEYYREVMGEKLSLSINDSTTLNAAVALLLEESDLSLTKLVDYVFEKLKSVGEKLKEKENGVLTLGIVKSAVVFVGQRVLYGVPNLDADVLEDESPSSLWCWETRDVKLMPNSVRGLLKIRRLCRKKIHERITAVLAVIQALEKPEDDPTSTSDFMKSYEKLGKVLNESDIRSLVNGMLQKNGTEMAAKEAKQEEKLLIRQLEKSKLEAEKERKRKDLELQKEKREMEKKQKRQQEAAEKDEKRQLKRQQEEAEKEQRRHEKEEMERKKQRSTQKQASFMELFLKKSKTNPSGQDDSTTNAATSLSSSKESEIIPDAVTSSMDNAMLTCVNIQIHDIRGSHLLSWKQLGHGIRSKRTQHWSARQKPKTEMYKKPRESLSQSCSPPVAKNHMRKQLLQFDKSYRPPFYGLSSKKSNVVGPRHPFKKDPDLDYDFDSDEEWEEEEPGESLSDCDKDDEEECLENACSKADEDESEDGFFVPDGYLSEDEGVDNDRDQTVNSVEEDKSSPGNSPQDPEIEEFYSLLQQQKYLNNLTEVALKKNQPLIILNLMHENALSSETEDSGVISKRERLCLQTLSIRALPGAPPIEKPANDMECHDEAKPTSNSKTATTPTPSIQDSDIPVVVSVIQSCSQSINKVVESLQQKFPTVSKSQLRHKVREVSDYVDNQWKVKKEFLGDKGMSPSPDKKSGNRNQKILSFFSKRCIPPTGTRLPSDETSQR